MVTAWQCVLPSLILCCTLNVVHSTHQDESQALASKQVPGHMLRYILMTMRHQNSHPQLLSRGVRRMGSEFLGKRSIDSLPDQKDDQFHEDGSEDPVNLKKEELGFTGQYNYDDSNESSEHSESIFSSPEKRDNNRYYGGSYRNNLKNVFSLLMSKKIMGSEFLGKRMGSEFLGKRAMGSEFLGKRAMGSEFLGKRGMGSEFLGKRGMGSELLRKRGMGSEFLGKRAMGSEFLGKRAMGSEFLGKRAMGSEFLGKRAMGSEFLGKRADTDSGLANKRVMGSEFLGKRTMGSEFLGKRVMGSEFLGKRTPENDYTLTSNSGAKRIMGSEFLG